MKTHLSVISRRALFWGVAGSAALMGASIAWWRSQTPLVSSASVEAFWRQRFEQPEGGEIHCASLSGRPLLLNFWATWCPPCVEELPMIDAFFRENAHNGFQVLALAVDQPAAVKRFLSRQPMGFPVGLAGLQGSVLAESLGNSSGGLPFSVFFDGDGSIWRQKLGRLSSKDLQEWRASLQP